MTINVCHSWATNVVVCSAERLQLYTTTNWDIKRAITEAQSLVIMNSIGGGLPKSHKILPIGGRKIGDGKIKVSTIYSAQLIAQHGDIVL